MMEFPVYAVLIISYKTGIEASGYGDKISWDFLLTLQ